VTPRERAESERLASEQRGPPELARIDQRAELERTLAALLPRVRKWLYRALGPDGPLDDAAQDTLIELARALPKFEARSSLETFAHRITLRVAYRYYGRARRLRALVPGGHEPLELERVESAARQPDALSAEREALTRLHRYLSKLPEKRRTAFVLCAIEGLEPHEAAALVGTSAGSMRARYMHARDELARLLGEHQGGRR
jgi:RNA polymerase sigma factor (sigma-70 family)